MTQIRTFGRQPDVRWFIAESLIGDERSFDILLEEDEYALCAIEDSIAYLANNVSIQTFSFPKRKSLGG